MRPNIHLQTDTVTIWHGDSIATMRELPDNSVDSIVTDPPYGLSSITPDQIAGTMVKWATGDRDYMPTGKGFMGKSWDGFVPPPALWDEAMRVLKPGGHLLAFAGSRTQDLMGMSIRLAGFEIRDNLAWLYGSGFPKSQGVHKVSLKRVTSRYGDKQCDCLDAGNGRANRYGLGQEDRRSAGSSGEFGALSAGQARTADLSVIQGAAGDALQQLRGDDNAEGQGVHAVAEAVLLPDLRGRGPEAPGHGSAAIRAGLEESPGRSEAPGQDVPVMREDSRAERSGAACSSPRTLSVRGDKPSGESSGALRLVSSHDRGDDEQGAGLDRDRSEPRRTYLDGECGRQESLARICSWCGLPDPEWLDSLKPLGTALKPAFEPVVVARKPLVGTVAQNVQQYGTGALNIDACRIEGGQIASAGGTRRSGGIMGESEPLGGWEPTRAGRWPANVVLDDTTAQILDQQSGIFKGVAGGMRQVEGKVTFTVGEEINAKKFTRGTPDEGGASRFFYVAKAPKRERPVVDGVAHPTVKPLALMRYLVKLVTPPGGVVLDPFAGSGTTVEACLLEGFDHVGIEREADYLPLIAARLDRQAGTLPAAA